MASSKSEPVASDRHPRNYSDIPTDSFINCSELSAASAAPVFIISAVVFIPSVMFGLCQVSVSFAALYGIAFEPAQARRIAKGLEFHYTPVHGSWLNMAEIELSVLSNQCINRRISDEAVLKREVLALERERNEAVAVIDWRFSTQHARTKLQHIYPPYSDGNGTRSTQLLRLRAQEPNVQAEPAAWAS